MYINNYHRIFIYAKKTSNFIRAKNLHQSLSYSMILLYSRDHKGVDMAHKITLPKHQPWFSQTTISKLGDQNKLSNWPEMFKKTPLASQDFLKWNFILTDWLTISSWIMANTTGLIFLTVQRHFSPRSALAVPEITIGQWPFTEQFYILTDCLLVYSVKRLASGRYSKVPHDKNYSLPTTHINYSVSHSVYQQFLSEAEVIVSFNTLVHN